MPTESLSKEALGSSRRKVRLDQLLVERGLLETRSKAQAAIMAGWVFCGHEKLEKAGRSMREDALLEVHAPVGKDYVGRGGYKLAGALDHWQLDPTGLICVDVGASTGGFTDCLLQRGATMVYALDVGHNQLHWKLREDSRVVVQEGVNARYLNKEDFEPEPTWAVMDLSFISLKMILLPVARILAEGGSILALVKPQFELGREKIPRGGVVRSLEDRQAAVDSVRDFVEKEVSLHWRDVVESSLPGTDGNHEFMAWIEKV
ncbi:MAG: TlyA family RNA methyltransferase [Verrucomicrobiales bacterium]